MNNKLKIFTNGFVKENPLLVLNIGLCSSLGVTITMFNGLGMGISMTFVLLMSEIVISIFRNHIPSSIRLPVFIIVIAAFTTIVELVLNAYVESLYSALGVFLPLIVVNCIIMGRVEAFASKNSIGDSVLDALGMGLGYTAVLLIISIIRELFGAGTLMAGTPLQVRIIPEAYCIGLLNSAPGGFMVFGFLGALMQGIKNSKENKARSAKKLTVENLSEEVKTEEVKAAETKTAGEEAKAEKAPVEAGTEAAKEENV